ncbi:MAG: hypothetical protein V4653_02610 [Pseudomonadota bacterium]
MVSRDGVDDISPLPAPRLRPVSGVQAPERAAGPAAISVLDRLLGRAAPDLLTCCVIAYLAAPALLFLASWATPVLAGAAILAGACALVWAIRRVGPWPLGLRATALCCALGLLWAVGTGSHHLLYSTEDWQIRDAVLRDLASGPWPVAYLDAGGETWLLRAPLGFYLPAGLAGRLFGLPAAQGMLWAWSGMGLGLVLALLATLARTLDAARPRRAFAMLALVFVLFHGADIVPNVLLDLNAGASMFAGWGRGGERWDRIFQYSGHVTTLLWTPNHSLPSWLTVLLLLRHHQASGFLRVIALPLAAAAFWTPVGGSAAVPHGPLVAFHPPLEALGRWLLLLTVEVLPWAAPVALLLQGGGWLLRAAVVLLCLLPLYVFGPGDEMTAHGGMAPLAVLAVAAGAAMLVPRAQAHSQAAWYALRVVAALALVGSVLEASLLVTRPAWPASRDCAVPQAARQSVFEGSTNWSHYLVPWPERALRPWLGTPVLRLLPPPDQAPRCWPAGGG